QKGGILRQLLVAIPHGVFVGATTYTLNSVADHIYSKILQQLITFPRGLNAAVVASVALGLLAFLAIVSVPELQRKGRRLALIKSLNLFSLAFLILYQLANVMVIVVLLLLSLRISKYLPAGLSISNSAIAVIVIAIGASFLLTITMNYAYERSNLSESSSVGFLDIVALVGSMILLVFLVVTLVMGLA